MCPMSYEDRRRYAKHKAEHARQQEEFLKSDGLVEGGATLSVHRPTPEPVEQKAALGPPENKMQAGPPENKARAVDEERLAELEAMTKRQLERKLMDAGLVATREDGREDLVPLKSDIIRALLGA